MHGRCPQAGAADTVAPSSGPLGAADPNGDYASCGTEFDRRYNPSNTGNIRGQSRFSLTDDITLTVDPSYQWVKANGGGTVTAREFGYDINPAGTEPAAAPTARPRPTAPPSPASPATSAAALHAAARRQRRQRHPRPGHRLAPSQTRTRRIGVIAGLRWDFAADQTVRVTYTYDRANHRQTGEVGLVDANGEPLDVFPINDPVADANGFDLQKRDRQSYAILNKFAGEYRGEFGRLTALDRCVACRSSRATCRTIASPRPPADSSSAPAATTRSTTQAGTLNPYTFNAATGAVTGWSPPGERTLKYKKFLPNVGASVRRHAAAERVHQLLEEHLGPEHGQPLQRLLLPGGSRAGQAEAGDHRQRSTSARRYRNGKIQAQVAGWFTKFNNRLASAFDPELNATVYRNLGRVDK